MGAIDQAGAYDFRGETSPKLRRLWLFPSEGRRQQVHGTPKYYRCPINAV